MAVGCTTFWLANGEALTRGALLTPTTEPEETGFGGSDGALTTEIGSPDGALLSPTAVLRPPEGATDADTPVGMRMGGEMVGSPGLLGAETVVGTDSGKLSDI